MNKWVSGEWLVEHTTAERRRALHYWFTIVWLTAGLAAWIILRDALWFVGFMSLYAIWVSHIAGWAAETPVQHEEAVEEVAEVLAEDAVTSRQLVTEAEL